MSSSVSIELCETTRRPVFTTGDCISGSVSIKSKIVIEPGTLDIMLRGTIDAMEWFSQTDHNIQVNIVS